MLKFMEIKNNDLKLTQKQTTYQIANSDSAVKR